MPASSATVSLLEAISLVATAAQQHGCDPKLVASTNTWCESEEGRAWLQAHVVESDEFNTTCKDSDNVATADILKRCIDLLEELDEEEEGEGTGVPPPMPAALSVLKYVAEADDDDEGMKDALAKLRRQLPMIASLQTTLGMLPPEFAKMIDTNAAKMGQAVRDKQKQQGGGAMPPQEMLSTVLNNPAFAEMMKAMMEQDEAPDEDAHMRERAADARHRVLEHRVTQLETTMAQLLEKLFGKAAAAAATKSEPTKPTTARRNKKKLGGRTNNHTPLY